jgi:hypothetical protein
MIGSDRTAWVAACASQVGWYRTDSAQRNVEASVEFSDRFDYPADTL